MPVEEIQGEALRNVEALLTAFGRCADRGDGAALSELFLAEGVLAMGLQQISGRAAIAQFTNERCADPARKTRHTWSNLQVETAPDGTLHATAIQQTYEQSGSGAPAQVRVSDLADTFAKDSAAQWRFARRQISRVFNVG